MATFEDLRAELRETKLVEPPTDFYGDVTILHWLEEASREIASAFRFPRKDAQLTEDAGTTELSLDEPPLDVMSVSFGGVGLARRNFRYVRFYQQLTSQRWPRAWFFDSYTGGPIQVGPANSSSGEFEVQYVGSPYSSSVNGTTEIWEGLFPGFHDLVLLRATVDAFEKGFEFEEAGHYVQRYQMRLQEFAQFLGISPPQGLTVQNEGGGGS